MAAGMAGAAATPLGSFGAAAEAASSLASFRMSSFCGPKKKSSFVHSARLTKSRLLPSVALHSFTYSSGTSASGG